MTRSKRSVAPTKPPPEFFLDRGLGRGVAEELSALGWVVHRITECFPDDAQSVDDADWIEYGLTRGWSALCKDGRIKGRDHERRPIEEHGGVLFYLDNQHLVTAEMVRRFHRSRDKIWLYARQRGPAIYAVSAEATRRTWPTHRRT